MTKNHNERVEADEDVEYEKDLNELKEQILKDGDTLVSKRDLLERFCEIDKEYRGHPWNLLQILANINILIGEEPSEDAVSRKEIQQKINRLWNSNGDKDYCMETLRDFVTELSPVTPTRNKGKWIDTTEISINKQGQIVHEVICSKCNGISYFRSMGNKYIGANLCSNCGTEMENG